MRHVTAQPARENRAPSIPAFRQAESNYLNLSLESQTNHAAEHDVEHQTLSTARGHYPVDNLDQERVLSQVSHLDDENLLSMLYNDTVTADHESSTFGTWPTDPSTTTEHSASWQSMGQTNDTNGNPTHLAIDDISITPNNSRASPHHQRPDLMIHTTPDKRQINRPTSRSDRPNSQNFIPNFNKFVDSTTGPNPAALMQRLTQLGSVMYELQSMYSPEEHGSRLSSDIFPTELAGKVLQAAIGFLKFLRCFFLDNSSSSSASNTPSVRQRYPSMPDLSDMEDGNHHRAFSPHPTLSDPRAHPSGSYSSSVSSTELSSRRVCAIDKPTTLQLIANYLRLLQLYLLLHNAIYDYIRLTESDFRHSQPIWSDLTIGGAPLYHFADFQIKLVLQVAARLLEEIEGALGLAEGCRTSKKSAAEGSGILGMNVTAHFVEICMSEATTGTEQGRGAIARLRDLMHCLMNMLDSPVWL
ncbi:hypothetical protein F5X99DRAFT_427594 [Biscogniauxia marginata]|nr:hypothetical protein F5X99DRAFT_427594 [Biscogniauxia marginata]